MRIIAFSLVALLLMLSSYPEILFAGQNYSTPVPQSEKPPRDDVYYTFRALEMMLPQHKPDSFEKALGVKEKTIYDYSEYITVIYCGHEDKQKMNDYGSVTYVFFSSQKPSIMANQDKLKPGFQIKRADYDEKAELVTLEAVWGKDGTTDTLFSIQHASSGTYVRQSSYPLKWVKTWTKKELEDWFAVR